MSAIEPLAESLVRPADQVHGVAMFQHHSLGHTGRARGINHIGQMFRRQPYADAFRICVCRSFPPLRVSIQSDHADSIPDSSQQTRPCSSA